MEVALIDQLHFQDLASGAVIYHEKKNYKDLLVFQIFDKWRAQIGRRDEGKDSKRKEKEKAMQSKAKMKRRKRRKRNI